jgi:hypothetical protein
MTASDKHLGPIKRYIDALTRAPPVVGTETRGWLELHESRDDASAEYTLRIGDGVRITQAHPHCGGEGVNLVRSF